MSELKPLQDLVARSQKIGADQSMVVYGGGNTSSKGEIKDHLGRLKKVLWVKGSGADMQYAIDRDYPALYLEELLALRDFDALDDDTMVDYVTRALVDPTSRRPSIETLLHGFLPAKHIDHVHADAICALTNHPQGEKAVREALGADYSAIEECKADVLGLYMVTQLFNKGELTGSLDDYQVRFVASVFRSVRFGAASAHGKANMITFNTLLNSGCIVAGKKGYTVNVVAMKSVIEKLAAELLHLQGDGDKSGVDKMLQERGIIKTSLQEDLAKLEKAKIPVDIIFDQGIDTLGLKAYDEAEKSKDKKEKK